MTLFRTTNIKATNLRPGFNLNPVYPEIQRAWTEALGEFGADAFGDALVDFGGGPDSFYYVLLSDSLYGRSPEDVAMAVDAILQFMEQSAVLTIAIDWLSTPTKV